MSQPLNTRATGGGVTVRPAVENDVTQILALVLELADYELLGHAVDATAEGLHAALFGASAPRVFCDIAEWEGTAAGFALWFYNFSTFRGRHGIFLEDLYVRPALRSHGLGKALLQNLARRCVGENLARMEWSVLDWNTPSIDFYRAQGAVLLDDWTTCRLSGEALAALGAPA